MLGNDVEEFEAAPINGGHAPCGETANVGSDASRLNIDNNVRPFEEKTKLALGLPVRLG